jgi:hypothetical protein
MRWSNVTPLVIVSLLAILAPAREPVPLADILAALLAAGAIDHTV